MKETKQIDLLQELYNLEYTEDGSPTLRVGQGESMHHSGGAASESKYIYETALDFFYSKNRLPFDWNTFLEFKKNKKLEDFLVRYSIDPEVSHSIQVLSMGFGLGYNELIFAAWALQNKVDVEKLSLDSFELDTNLYLAFNEWLNLQDTAKETVYDQVLISLYPEKVFHAMIKELLKTMLLNKTWRQNMAMTTDSLSVEKYSVILYDAFSSKTNPELWSFEFLDKILKKHTQSHCVFSTYACKGELKRVLEANSFEFIKRQGFKGKRDASLAFRV
jgi:tRNA U34 5-methylaminomethyl-2-thiouridine-forming methyltransferase MnmC